MARHGLARQYRHDRSLQEEYQRRRQDRDHAAGSSRHLLKLALVTPGSAARRNWPKPPAAMHLQTGNAETRHHLTQGDSDRRDKAREYPPRWAVAPGYFGGQEAVRK